MNIEYIIVLKKGELCSNKESFVSLLEVNSKIQVFKKKITYDGSEVSYNLDCEEIPEKEELVFHLSISSSNRDDNKNIESLNSVSRGIRKTIKGSGLPFYFNTTWDEVSQYYCTKCYPIINEIENLLRKLISQFMLKSLGSDWIKVAIPRDLKAKIQDTAEKSKAENKYIDILYHADFIQLIELLFQKYSKTQSLEELFEIIEENQLETIDTISEYRPQSNWDRYFSGLIEFDDFAETWQKLYRYRNIIAHNKLIHKQDYDDVLSITKSIKEKLLEALEKVAVIEIPEEDKAEISRFTEESIYTSKAHARRENLISFDSDFKLNTGSAFGLIMMATCSTCGKALETPINEVRTDNLCNDCRGGVISSFHGISLTQKACKICGEPLLNSSMSIDSDICLSCKSKPHFLYPNSKDNLLNDSLGAAAPYRFCLSCGSVISSSASGNFCDDCKPLEE